MGFFPDDYVQVEKNLCSLMPMSERAVVVPQTKTGKMIFSVREDQKTVINSAIKEAKSRIPDSTIGDALESISRFYMKYDDSEVEDTRIGSVSIAENAVKVRIPGYSTFYLMVNTPVLGREVSKFLLKAQPEAEFVVCYFFSGADSVVVRVYPSKRTDLDYIAKRLETMVKDSHVEFRSSSVDWETELGWMVGKYVRHQYGAPGSSSV